MLLVFKNKQVCKIYILIHLSSPMRVKSYVYIYICIIGCTLEGDTEVPLPLTFKIQIVVQGLGDNLVQFNLFLPPPPHHMSINLCIHI